MEIELRDLIVGAAGAPPADRVNWGWHPQGAAYPAVTLNVIDDIERTHMKGPDGLSAARVQVDCYDGTYGATKALANAVRAALSGYCGGRFQGVFFDGARDFNDPGQTQRPYRVSLDFIVNYER